MGYNSLERVTDPADAIKFGKKVNYESKISNSELLEEHLKQMRRNIMSKEEKHGSKLK